MIFGRRSPSLTPSLHLCLEVEKKKKKMKRRGKKRKRRQSESLGLGLLGLGAGVGARQLLRLLKRRLLAWETSPAVLMAAEFCGAKSSERLEVGLPGPARRLKARPMILAEESSP